MEIKKLASFGLRNSIYEMEYFYKKFIENYSLVQEEPKDLNELNFLLSAFLNKYQTLKDIYPRLGKNKTWKEFNNGKKERLFFKPIRNIFTHQGDMLINTCQGNEFFIGGPLYVINGNKIEEIAIEKTPVKELVKIFFKEIIEEIISEIQNNEIDLILEMDDLDIKNEILKNKMLPEFVKGKIMQLEKLPENPKDLKKEFIAYLNDLYRNI